ncbi:hypothetical protein K443DRAFT_206217 [Laccaria amethystina LaAM-08-1]|uniref:Uncharacterized protein n=1 Tax=Laccaria amethystina LaAM-08-1 TaxID=1095629 RepID=A0A0C9XRJ9_9AGAR|nr:hypothetical protein K443DRAFT_206217 [Laccaria amethystina LaAM-08-1]
MLHTYGFLLNTHCPWDPIRESQCFGRDQSLFSPQRGSPLFIFALTQKRNGKVQIAKKPTYEPLPVANSRKRRIMWNKRLALVDKSTSTLVNGHRPHSCCRTLKMGCSASCGLPAYVFITIYVCFFCVLRVMIHCDARLSL